MGIASMKHACFNLGMTDHPLRDGVRRLLTAARHEEWTLSRVLTMDELDHGGIRELLARSNAARRTATHVLQEVAAGRPADGCAPVEVEPVATWDLAHHAAHASTVALLEALDAATEDQLAADPLRQYNHPQYIWRDVVISGAREPMLGYAQWHHRQGRVVEGLSVLSRWYEAVRGAGLPTKARSDASYDLACGLSRAGRLDAAMQYLPDAFIYNDRGAVGVLKAWARQDADLAPLLARPDFRSLVAAT
jgi:hypothetical protein